MSRAVTLTLSDDLLEALRTEVSEGRADSIDAAVERALRDMFQPDVVAGIPVDELARLAQEAINDPEPPVSAADTRTYLDELYAEHTAEKAK